MATSEELRNMADHIDREVGQQSAMLEDCGAGYTSRQCLGRPAHCLGRCEVEACSPVARAALCRLSPVCGWLPQCAVQANGRRARARGHSTGSASECNYRGRHRQALLHDRRHTVLRYRAHVSQPYIRYCSKSPAPSQHSELGAQVKLRHCHSKSSSPCPVCQTQTYIPPRSLVTTRMFPALAAGKLTGPGSG